MEEILPSQAVCRFGEMSIREGAERVGGVWRAVIDLTGNLDQWLVHLPEIRGLLDVTGPNDTLSIEGATLVLAMSNSSRQGIEVLRRAKRLVAEIAKEYAVEVQRSRRRTAAERRVLAELSTPDARRARIARRDAIRAALAANQVAAPVS